MNAMTNPTATAASRDSQSLLEPVAETPTRDGAVTNSADITAEHVAQYRRDGFTRVRNVLGEEEIATFRDACTAYYEAGTDAMKYAKNVFSQQVNVWQNDKTIRQLTLSPRIGQMAEKFAGGPLRLWHDQLLVKAPGKSTPTEFHQDQPYWPHAGSTRPISCWIALVDVPPEKGCMTFIPRSHRRTDLGPTDLLAGRGLFEIAPELEWVERVTVPLRAGDCTFHHGRCAHMATPNTADDPRVAHVMIYIDADTRFTGGEHVVTRPLGLEVGQPLEHDLFPPVSSL